MLTAHGVGRVYESPLPVWLYLLGAAATVIVSFAVRALATRSRARSEPRLVVGPRGASAVVRLGRAAAVALLVAIVALAIVEPERGLTPVPLLFWVVLVVGMIVVSALMAGLWERIDPWQVLASALGLDDPAPRAERDAPWWVGPVLLYGLFWFELVSGRGFDPLAILIVVTAYAIYVVTFRNSWGSGWEAADPLSILFGFAERTAPFELTEKGVTYRGPLRGLAESEPMPPALFASVFVLLASTTLDNLRETVEWSSFLRASGLSGLDRILVDSVGLAALTIPFLGLFVGTVAIARRWLRTASTWELARALGWSLIPIGVAYVLAHNLPLLMTGIPRLVSQALDAVGVDFLERYAPSPQLVWFVEIAAIVGGHVLGVLAAHATTERLASSRRHALYAHTPLALLMSLFTVTTLWLLSLPLVTDA